MLSATRFPILASSIATLFTLPLGAQTPAEKLKRPAVESMGTTTALGEVVVTADADRTAYRAETSTTATRLPAPILDTPRSVQVVTERVIKDRAILDPQEAVQNVSGVQRGGSRSGFGETYFVRGFRQQGLFKDGFRAGETASGAVFTFEGPTDIANIERVEVLKGPSAILFGRGEPGGTVNYITRTPLFENRFSLQQQIGSYDFYRTEAHANWNVVPDRFALSLDAAYENTESFIDFVEGERYFVAPAFTWKITPDTTLTFRGEYSNDTRSTTTALPYFNGEVLSGTPYNRYFGEPGFTEMDTEAWRGLLTLDHRWSESHRTTVSLHRVSSQADGGNFILNNFAGPLVDPVTGDVARAAEKIDFTNNYFAARLDHVWDWTIYEGASSKTITDKDGKSVTLPGSGFPTIKNQLLISGEFDRQETEGVRVLSSHTPLNPRRPNYTGYSPLPLLPIPGFPVTFVDDRSTDADATSILLLDRISFGDTVHLSFGGRYEWFDANSQFAYSTPIFGAASNDIDEENFNPTVGLVVKPARNVAIFGSYSASTNSFQNVSATTATGAQLDPEESRQFEAGVKVDLFGGKVFTSLSVFQIEKSDVAATDPSNPFFSINAGEERSRGVEFDIAGEPIPGWRITANYAYIDAQVTDEPTGVNVGHRLPGVPEHSGGIFTTYEIQQGPLKGLGFGGGAYFSDRTEIDRSNSGNLSGWAQVDAVVYYQRDRFRAQINVKNLTDEEFYYAGSFGNEVQRAAGRTVIASLKYEF